MVDNEGNGSIEDYGASLANLPDVEQPVGHVEAMMGRLATMVEEFPRRMDRVRDVREWRIRPVLQETVAHGLNEVFKAKFIEINRLHDLGTTKEKPKDIIHYTSLNMLISVLQDLGEGKKSFLRMNDSFHLNDPEEGQYLIRHISQRDQLTWFKERNISHAYVASFIIPDDCKGQQLGDEDDLKYWLAYGRRGRGCSIRFPVNNERFQRILYGQDNATHSAQMLELQSIWNLLNPLTGSQHRELRRTANEVLSEAMWNNLAQIGYLYKDDSYEYERECRLVRSVVDIPEGDVYFQPVEPRASPQSNRHYYQDNDLSMDRILITGSKITLGPLVPHPDSMVYYIETLLKKARLSGPRIEISKIPYQEPWQ